MQASERRAPQLTSFYDTGVITLTDAGTWYPVSFGHLAIVTDVYVLTASGTVMAKFNNVGDGVPIVANDSFGEHYLTSLYLSAPIVAGTTLSLRLEGVV
jgi:hypothetical protein